MRADCLLCMLQIITLQFHFYLQFIFKNLLQLVSCRISNVCFALKCWLIQIAKICKLNSFTKNNVKLTQKFNCVFARTFFQSTRCSTNTIPDDMHMYIRRYIFKGNTRLVYRWVYVIWLKLLPLLLLLNSINYLSWRF